MARALEKEWTLEKVMELTGDEMTELWKTLPAPEFRELQGEYQGHVRLAEIDEALVKEMNETMKNPDGIWIGKAFNATGDNEGEGYNHWSKEGTNGIREKRYRTAIEISEIDGKPALMMDYGPFIEPTQEWYFKDEVRKLNDDIYILMGVRVTTATGDRNVSGPIALTGPIHEWVGPDQK